MIQWETMDWVHAGAENIDMSSNRYCDGCSNKLWVGRHDDDLDGNNYLVKEKLKKTNDKYISTDKYSYLEASILKVRTWCFTIQLN